MPDVYQVDTGFTRVWVEPNHWGANAIIVKSKHPDVYYRPLPMYAQLVGAYSFFTLPITGVLSGVVLQSGVPVSNRMVRLYLQRSGEMLRAARTNTAGEFSFTELANHEKYYAVALDDADEAPDYNARIFASLTPVTL